MKMSTADRARLSAAIAPLDTPERRTQYLAGDFPRAGAVKNLDMRYRWDLYYAAARVDRGIYFEDQGYADAHIHTALRSIVPALIP